MQQRQFGDVCQGCISDEFLAGEVEQLGHLSLCEYCGETRATITMDALGDRIHDVINEHFRLTPGYPDDPYEYFSYKEGKWERRGYPVDFIITDLAGVDERVAKDLTSLLSARYAYTAAKEGDENPYGYEAMYEALYEEQALFDLWFRSASAWAEFRREIQSRSRFHNTAAEKLLAEMFGDLSALKSSTNSPVIRELIPENQDHSFWRGRVVQSNQELEHLLKFPAKELGPPPSKFAKAGRMNAQGISVFYGGLERATCLSELRPPVGSRVVIGQFELLRTITLLDLDALAKVYVDTSTGSM